MKILLSISLLCGSLWGTVQPVPVSGSVGVTNFPATQPISAVSLPLPTGAATETTLSAINTKIPASPSTDRTTAAAPFSTRLSDGAAFYKATTPSDTQPISAASLPLPSGAATSTLQTTGNTSLASIDSKLTNPLPISGTVTANAGTNLNTSALALDATQTNRTAKAQVTDGTRDGTIKAASTAAAAADTALVVGLSPNSPLPTGSNVLGALSANQTVNVAQMNGAVVSMGAGTTGTGVQRVVLPTDQSAIPAAQSGVWSVNATSVASNKTTYRAANISIAMALLTTDFFTITGSATKIVKILGSNCNFTGGGSVYSVQLVKRSTSDTGGVSTLLTNVSMDSTNAAGTATVRSYTTNPTLGTLVGAMAAKKLGSPLSSGTVTPGVAEYNFDVSSGQPIVLRGISEVVAWNGNAATGSTNGSCDVTWTEE